MKYIKRRKFTALVVLLCLLSVLVSGCSKWMPRNPYKMYLIVKSTETEFWKSVFTGANAATAEYNIDLTICGPKTEEEYEKQNELISEAIENGADAIVFSAISYTENAPAIDEAIRNGIKVIVIDSDVNSSGVCARIGTDNTEAGRKTADAVLAMDESRICVGIVNMDKGTQNGRERENGLRERMEADPRVEDVFVVNVATDSGTASLAAKQLLTEHPQINVLVGLNEPLAVGAAMAVDSMNLKDTVHMIGFDTNVKCVELMREGVINALIAQNPYAMGYLGVETAWKALEGKEYQSELIDTGTTIITQDTLFTPEGQRAVFRYG